MRQTYSLTPELIADIRATAKQLDRSVSWVIRTAWQIAKPKITAIANAQNGLKPYIR